MTPHEFAKLLSNHKEWLLGTYKDGLGKTKKQIPKRSPSEKEARYKLYKEGKLTEKEFLNLPPSEVSLRITNLGLEEEQQKELLKILDIAITDTMYTILLGLDGCMNVGGVQENYKLYDEHGNLLTGGELESAAYEVFHENDSKF
jgi:hypothetical protein